MVPSAPACSTRVMLLHPSIVKIRLLKGGSILQTPAARKDATQGFGAEGEGLVGYPGPPTVLGVH